MTDITEITDKLDRIYDRTEEIGEFNTRDSEIRGLLDDIGDLSETVERDIEDLMNINETYEEVIEQKQEEHERTRNEINRGFADKVLEKWFGGYTLPTALWKDEVRGKSDIDHNKRKTLVATGGFLAGGALAGGAADYLNGDGAPARPPGASSDSVTLSVSDSERVGSYLEDVVQDSDLLSAQRNWGDLLEVYDFEEGEFFSDSDRTLEGLEVIYNQGSRYSEYGVSIGIDGETEFDTRTLKDDRAAESALEYFEVEE